MGDATDPANLAGIWGADSFQDITAKMIVARDHLTMTPLPDGTVLIAGGIGNESEAYSSAELYRP